MASGDAEFGGTTLADSGGSGAGVRRGNRSDLDNGGAGLIPGDGVGLDVTVLPFHNDGGVVADLGCHRIPGLHAVHNGAGGKALLAGLVSPAVYRVRDEGLHEVRGGGSIDGNNLVADLKWILVARQVGAIDVADQDLAIVEVGIHVQPGFEIRQRGEFVVTVLKAGDVAGQDIVEGNIIFGFINLIEPGLNVVEIETKKITPQFIRSVIFGI